MSDEDDKSFKKSVECYTCNKKDNKTDVRVRDHCYVTGTCKYR